MKLEKQCTKCKQVKDYNEFYWRAKEANLRLECKERYKKDRRIVVEVKASSPSVNVWEWIKRVLFIKSI